jgi:hypothetical protein
LNAIECIRDFSTFFDKSQAAAAEAIRTALCDYVQSIADVEWQEMSEPGKQVNSDTSEQLYELMRQCRPLKTATKNEHLALSASVDNVAEITKMRTRRICLANEQLPARLRRLVQFMSVVLVIGFAAMGVRNAWIHGIMLVSSQVASTCCTWFSTTWTIRSTEFGTLTGQCWPSSSSGFAGELENPPT